MTLLILGLILWVAAHFLNRLAPDLRTRMGDPGKGMVAIAIIISVVLMVLGYRSADGAVFWGRSGGLVGINNLLMILAFYMYAVSGPKGARVWVGTKVRHPQLVGFSIWAVAHLLVNGDVPSFVLFGGLLVWSLGSIVLINAQEGAWTPPEQAPMKKEAVAVVITLVVVAIVIAIHTWLGVTPVGG